MLSLCMFFLFVFVACVSVLGSKLRSTMTHWKYGMAPQRPLLWSVNTMAPKHLISWFPPPTSCSCCSLQTTAALQQASASDMKVRLIDWLIEMFGRQTESLAGTHTQQQCFVQCSLSANQLKKIHSPSWLSGICASSICDPQVWKWSQTLVSILVSLSMAVAMAAAFQLAPVSHLHVTQDTHWVIRSQLFASRIINGVTLFPVVMVRIFLSFILSLLMNTYSGLKPFVPYSKRV